MRVSETNLKNTFSILDSHVKYIRQFLLREVTLSKYCLSRRRFYSRYILFKKNHSCESLTEALQGSMGNEYCCLVTNVLMFSVLTRFLLPERVLFNLEDF